MLCIVVAAAVTPSVGCSGGTFVPATAAAAARPVRVQPVDDVPNDDSSDLRQETGNFLPTAFPSTHRKQDPDHNIVQFRTAAVAFERPITSFASTVRGP